MQLSKSLLAATLLVASSSGTLLAGSITATLVNGRSNSVSVFSAALAPLSNVAIPVVPAGLAARDDGSFYIASGNHTYEFDAAGNQIHAITGSPTTITGSLSFSGTNVFAALTDGAANAVAIFSPTLGFVNQFTVAGPPQGVAADASGGFYVSSGNRTYEYDSAGTLLHTISGNATTQTPKVAFNGTNVFVTVIDGAFNGVAIFTPTLGFVNQFAIAGSPLGLTADAAGNFYVSSGNAIYEYSFAGALLKSFTGAAGDQFLDDFLVG